MVERARVLGRDGQPRVHADAVPLVREMRLRWLDVGQAVYYFMTAIGGVVHLFIEIASPFLLWTRLRWLMIFLATAMHAVIGVLMGLNLFELLMIVMLLAFLPDRVIRDRFRAPWDLAKLSLRSTPKRRIRPAPRRWLWLVMLTIRSSWSPIRPSRPSRWWILIRRSSQDWMVSRPFSS